MSRCTGHENGFTLTELLTAVAVAGLSLSLAVPGFGTMARNNQRAAAVNQLVAGLQGARAEAIRRNASVVVCPSRDGRSCDGSQWQDGWIWFADDGDRQPAADDALLGTADAVAHFAITSVEFPRSVVFGPGGRVLMGPSGATSGSFTFCDDRDPDGIRLLIIRPTGEPWLARTSNPPNGLNDGHGPDCIVT